MNNCAEGKVIPIQELFDDKEKVAEALKLFKDSSSTLTTLTKEDLIILLQNVILALKTQSPATICLLTGEDIEVKVEFNPDLLDDKNDFGQDFQQDVFDERHDIPDLSDAVSDEDKSDTEFIPQKQKAKGKKRGPKKGPLQCSQCEMTFRNPVRLEKHERSHAINTPKRTVKCDHCNLMFKFEHSLNDHIKSFHDELKVFKCEICNREFSRWFNLQRHTVRNHKDSLVHLRKEVVEKSECQICQQTFTTTESARRHMNLVHNKDAKRFVCDQCGKSFALNQGLRRHVASLHSKVKDYKCHLCPASFSRSDKLKIHIDGVHKGLKPFQCEICGEEFAVKAGLKSHSLKHNSDHSKLNCDSFS